MGCSKGGLETKWPNGGMPVTRSLGEVLGPKKIEMINYDQENEANGQLKRTQRCECQTAQSCFLGAQLLLSEVRLYCCCCGCKY